MSPSQSVGDSARSRQAKGGWSILKTSRPMERETEWILTSKQADCASDPVNKNGVLTNRFRQSGVGRIIARFAQTTD